MSTKFTFDIARAAAAVRSTRVRGETTAFPLAGQSDYRRLWRLRRWHHRRADVLAIERWTINVGDTVTFTNSGGTHNVVSDTAGMFRCANGCDGAGGNGKPSADGLVVDGHVHTAGHLRLPLRGTRRDGHAWLDHSQRARCDVRDFGRHHRLVVYNPAQSGQEKSFNVEVLSNNLFIAFWYVFDATRQQSLAHGYRHRERRHGHGEPRADERRLLPAEFRPDQDHATGMGHRSAFQSTSDCSNGTATWTPNDTTNFRRLGTMPIKRLTSVDGLVCQ